MNDNPHDFGPADIDPLPVRVPGATLQLANENREMTDLTKGAAT